MLTKTQFTLLFCAVLFGLTRPYCAVAAEDGAGTFAESCAGCHSAKVRPLVNLHLTKDQWKEAVDRMIDQGAEVPKGKIQELLDYLVKTYGSADAASDAKGK